MGLCKDFCVHGRPLAPLFHTKFRLQASSFKLQALMPASSIQVIYTTLYTADNLRQPSVKILDAQRIRANRSHWGLWLVVPLYRHISFDFRFQALGLELKPTTVTSHCESFNTLLGVHTFQVTLKVRSVICYLRISDSQVGILALWVRTRVSG